MNEFFCYPVESIMDDGKQRCNSSGKRRREAAIIKFCYPLQFEKLFSALDSWRIEPAAWVDEGLVWVEACNMALALFSTANIIFIVVLHVILAEIAGTEFLCNLPSSRKNVAEMQCDMTATVSALIIHEDVALFELQNAREIDFFPRRISGMHEMRKCLSNAFAS